MIYIYIYHLINTCKYFSRIYTKELNYNRVIDYAYSLPDNFFQFFKVVVKLYIPIFPLAVRGIHNCSFWIALYLIRFKHFANIVVMMESHIWRRNCLKKYSKLLKILSLYTFYNSV